MRVHWTEIGALFFRFERRIEKDVYSANDEHRRKHAQKGKIDKGQYGDFLNLFHT